MRSVAIAVDFAVAVVAVVAPAGGLKILSRRGSQNLMFLIYIFI